MRNVCVDIETYSDLPIGKVGLYRYADSPNFDILLISYAIDGGEVKTIDLTESGHSATGTAGASSRPTGTRDERGTAARDFIRLLSCEDVLMRAFNAVFEWYCISKYVLRQGWVTPEWSDELLTRTRCTMVHGLYLGYGGSLEKMGKAVGLPEEKSKLSVGKALIRLFSCPDADGRRVQPSQDPAKWRLYKEYNRNDVIAERELAKRFAPWPIPEKELTLWQQDARMNAQGICVDMPRVLTASTVWSWEREELINEAVALTGLDNPNSVSKLKTWLAGELDAETVSIRKADVKDMLTDSNMSDAAKRVLEIRQQLGKTSVSKYDALGLLTGLDDRVRGLLQFYGAHTGRWSGRGIQVHNLPKPTMSADELDLARRMLISAGTNARDAMKLCFGSLPDTLSQLIRTMLVPAHGFRFVIADYSAIEARVVAWLAGETWVNEVFATHGRIYEATAAQMFGVPISTIKKGESNYALRAKGKVATLALGYGGGENALVTMGALRMGLTEDEMPDIVARWRAANTQIRALWYALQEASVQTVKLGVQTRVRGLKLRLETSTGCGGGSKPPPYGDEGDTGCGELRFLTIELPSGRKLFYPEPKIVQGTYGGEEISYKAQTATTFKHTRAWGGVLTENVVQAIARDCLAELLLNIDALQRQDETAAWNLKFHVHDEVIVEVPAADAEGALIWLLDRMAAPIPWAPGLILKGDGFISNYYRKD